MNSLFAHFELPDTQMASLQPTAAVSNHESREVETRLQTMPRIYSYNELLQRILPSTQSHEMPDVRYEGIMATLMQQPMEIIVLVISQLAMTDLLNLRRVNKQLHELVHYSAESIGRSLADTINRTFKIEHLPIAIPDLESLIVFNHRLKSINITSRIISKRIATNLRCHSIQNDPEVLEEWQNKKRVLIAARLTRSFLILHQYLDFMRDTFGANEMILQPLDNDEYTTLTNIFDLDQQAFMNKHMSEMTEKDYIDVTATLNILKATCKARHVPFSLKSSIQPFISVQALFIYTGLLSFPSLLAEDITRIGQREHLLRDGKNLAKELRHQQVHINSVTNTMPLVGFEKAIQLSQQFDDRRDPRARDTFVQNQDIWDRAARSLMMQRLERFPIEQSATTWIRKVSRVPGEDRESDIIIGPWDHSDQR